MTRILLGLIGGLFLFDDESGRLDLCLEGVQPLSLALDPGSPGRVFCATYDRGLWCSEDRGARWLPVGTPGNYFEPLAPGAIPERATTFVSVEPKPGAEGHYPVWVGTEPGRLYRSDDAGQTFSCVTDWAGLPSRKNWSFPPRPDSYHVRWIAHGADGELHVSIEFGAVLHSRDGGHSFADRLRDSPRDAHVLLTHPAAPQRLYAALGDGIITEGRSWATSEDGGETWRYDSKGLEAMPYLYGLAVNPADPDDIRVAASRDPRTAHWQGPSSIFRRVGGEWSEDAAGFPRADSLVPSLAVDPERPGRWLALSNLGLFGKEGDDDWTCLITRPEWRDRHPTCVAVVPT